LSLTLRALLQAGRAIGSRWCTSGCPSTSKTPTERLAQVRAEMQRLKASGRAEGTETPYAVATWFRRRRASGGQGTVVAQDVQPDDLAIARTAWRRRRARPPDARGLLGGADHRAPRVAVGMVRYRRELFIGCYADPAALPEVTALSELLDAELRWLARSG
jgi:hypothetical protein